MVAMPTHTLKELQNLSKGIEEAQVEASDTRPQEQATEKILRPENTIEEKTIVSDEPSGPEFIEKAKNSEAEKKKKDFQNLLKKISEKKTEIKGTVRADPGHVGQAER